MGISHKTRDRIDKEAWAYRQSLMPKKGDIRSENASQRQANNRKVVEFYEKRVAEAGNDGPIERGPEYGSREDILRMRHMEPIEAGNSFQSSKKDKKDKTPLKKLAEIVRKQGERQDSVLAHISPAEAALLKKKFGGDKNPHTGLPQYGLKKFIKKLTKPVERLVKPILRSPIGGGLAGSVLAGPLGMIAGAGLGNVSRAKHKGLEGSSGKHFLRGALTGALMNYALPQVGGFLGVPAGGTLGNMMGVGGSSIANMVGIPNLIGPNAILGNPTLGGLFDGSGALGGLFGGDGRLIKEIDESGAFGGRTGYGPEMESAAGGGGGLFGGRLRGLMGLGGLGAMLYGMKKGKSEYTPYKGPSLRERMAAEGIAPTPVSPYVPPAMTQRRRIPIQNPNLFTPERIEPEYFESLPPTFKHGGHVGEGYFHGASGGQDDNRHTKMPERSYVMDATTISLYGDGNSEAGRHKLNELKEKFIKAAHEHGYERPHDLQNIDAMVSDGEDIWPPEAAFGAGILVHGDGNKGVKVLNSFRKNLRKQKGLKEFLPPKSKHPSYYLGVKNAK